MAKPELELIRKTFIIRKMDLPPSVKLTKRSLLRWFALAFGMVSEKDERNTALNILDTVFYFLITKKSNPGTFDIQKKLKEKYKLNVSEKLIRYHLSKLIEWGIIVRKKNLYFLNPAPRADRMDLKESFSHWVRNDVNYSLDEIETVLDKISQNYKK